MEESEKRRERLKAMRLEAAAATTTTTNASASSSSHQTLISTSLANPLVENQDSNVASAPPPRFDFYTDPMAAYATVDKRRPPTPTHNFPPSSQGPRNPGMPPPSSVQQFQGNYGPQPPPSEQFQGNYRPEPPSGTPQFQGNYRPQSPPPPCAKQFQNYSGHQPPPPSVHQFQSNYGPHQGMYRGGDPYYSPGPTSSPMGMRSPHPVHQGSLNFTNAPGRGNWFNNSPNPKPGNGGSPYPGYQGSPRSSPQGRGHWSNSPSPIPGRGGGSSPSGGRGRGQWDTSRMNPNSRYSGGRGRGYGDGQARSFYNKSMVEDPWESLTPVIWQADKDNDVSNFTNNPRYFQKTPTFQNTPIAKKLRVSNTFDASNSKGGSLADFLAESFDEAVEDAAAK